VRLDLVADGRSVAHTTIRRRWTTPGVRHEPVRDGLYGEVFEPAGSGRRPAALGDDALWPSSGFTTVLHRRLDERRFAHTHEDLQFADAGHLVGSAIPYLPAAVVAQYGGSARADAAGRAAAWPRILSFMRGLRGD
jgi:hypothetical protein